MRRSPLRGRGGEGAEVWVGSDPSSESIHFERVLAMPLAAASRALPPFSYPRKLDLYRT